MNVNEIIKKINEKKEKQVREFFVTNAKMHTALIELDILSARMNDDFKIFKTLESYGVQGSSGRLLQTECSCYEYFSVHDFYYKYYFDNQYIFFNPETLSVWAEDYKKADFINPTPFMIGEFIKACEKWSEKMHKILKEEGLK